MPYANNAFLTNPVFTVGPMDNGNEAQALQNPALSPLPEVEVQRPPGIPPENMDGTVATGVSTMARDRTAFPTAQSLIAQPVPASTLMEEAREFQIFISNSEIAMRTAAGDEDRLC